MRYLLDTNIWIYYLKNLESAVRQRMAATQPSELATCSVVWAELLHGARKYGNASQREQTVNRTLLPLVNLDFDLEAARHYARTRDLLERNGRMIGGNDLMIASIALSHGLVLVTHNCAEFSRIPDLQIEDWV